MASYEVTGADGQIYDIEGPEGASDQKIIAAVQRQIAADNPLPEIDPTQQAAQLGEEDVSTLGDVLKAPVAGLTPSLPQPGPEQAKQLSLLHSLLSLVVLQPEQLS